MTEVAAMQASEARGDDPRWVAVVERDHAAAGEFVYGVVTTGVYCRPGCAARRPRRENVRFYASCDDAEKRWLPALPALQPPGTTARRKARTVGGRSVPPSGDGRGSADP